MSNAKSLLAQYKTEAEKILGKYLDKYIESSGGYDYFFEKENNNFRKEIAHAGADFLLKNNNSHDNKELSIGVQLTDMDAMYEFMIRLKGLS
jgi:hypothetical protein